MEIRTYGVDGMMDWQCQIPVGRAKAIVHFTGGTMTSYGVTPAEYSTGDPVKQKIIENSDHFKNGRIKLLRKTGTPDPVKKRTPKPAPAPTTAVESTVAESPAKPADEQPAKEILQETESDKTPATSDSSEINSEADVDAFIEQTVTDAEAEGVGPQEVTVSCLTDAQNYLRDNFGIPTSKSRSKDKAQAFARENGIVFVGL